MKALRWYLLLAVAFVLPAEAVSLLDVEVIVFRYTDADLTRWKTPDPLPDYSAERLLESPAETTGRDAIANWTRKPDDALALTAAARALSRGSQEVVLHLGWRQPANSRHRVRLQSEDGSKLDGTVQLLGAGKRLQWQEDLLVTVGEQRIRVRNTQKLRPRELRYADHALLGVLVQVTPVAEAEDAASEPAPATGPSESEAPAAPAGEGPQAGPAD